MTTHETLIKAQRELKNYTNERLLIMAYNMLRKAQEELPIRDKWLDDNLTLEVIALRVAEIKDHRRL